MISTQVQIYISNHRTSHHMMNDWNQIRLDTHTHFAHKIKSNAERNKHNSIQFVRWSIESSNEFVYLFKLLCTVYTHFRWPSFVLRLKTNNNNISYLLANYHWYWRQFKIKVKPKRSTYFHFVYLLEVNRRSRGIIRMYILTS